MSISRKITRSADSGGGEPEGTYTDDVFSTFLWETTAANENATAVNGIDFAKHGGMIWLKNRNAMGNHTIFDSERGLDYGIYADNAGAQWSTTGFSFEAPAFNSDGYTTGTASVYANTGTHVGWGFRKAKKFFDVVTYTGEGNDDITLPHKLGIPVGMVIIKNLEQPEPWIVTTADLSPKFMQLNEAYEAASGVSLDSTDTTMTLGDSGRAYFNTAGKQYVAYVFAHDETDSGQIQCGTYTGTGGDLSIDLGWEPQLIMIKSANATGNWELFDSTRGISNISSYTLRPNLSSVEADFGGGSVTLNSNGFSVNVDFGVSGREYIYMAIRKPNKPRPFVGHYVDDVFSTYVYTGDNTQRNIENGIDLLGEGGLVWVKDRTRGYRHSLTDTERGPTKTLASNETQAEVVEAEYLNGFLNNGFSLGNQNGTNSSAHTYASWTFRKAPSFFDVVTWTGDGVDGREIPHNLGCQPGMVIVKQVSGDRDWAVNHVGIDGSTHWLSLNQNIPSTARNDIFGQDLNNAGTESFKVGDAPWCNGTTSEYVAYVFAHDDHEDGYIQCGSYTGTGAAGNEIDLGWEPQWVLFKNASQQGTDWQLVDSMRGMIAKGEDARLEPNNPSEEYSYEFLSPTPTGFLLESGHIYSNNSGDNYIYMAIRRPNKPAEEFEPEELFALAGNTYTTSDPAFVSGFPVDMGLSDGPSMGWDKDIATRLTGTKRQETNKDSAEGNQTAYKWDYMNGYMSGTNGSTYGWQWRRQPGFFDVVTHTCDGNQGTLYPHGLGVVPDMVWRKERNATGDWRVWVRAMPNTSDGANGGTKLNTDLPYYPSDTQWASKVPPTDTHLSNGVFRTAGREIVSYLFASVPGICDIGTYTGNGVGPWSSPGDSLKVDCGFTNGARFVLVKRTDAQANWIFFDTLRGSQSTLSLNTNNAEVLAQYGTDAPWPLYPQGFAVVDYNFDTELHNPNISGAEYIYMAIA